MKLDPYNEFVTTINFAITNVDGAVFPQIFWGESTPNDSFTSKIQNQYKLLFDYLDYQEVLQSDIASRYLEELVTLAIRDGGIMTLRVFGTTAEESEDIADRLYTYLLDNSSVISSNTYSHSLSILDRVTQTISNPSLADEQKAHLENVTTSLAEVESLKQQLESLVLPTKETPLSVLDIFKSAIKYAVLGVALGVVLGLVWIMVSYLFRNRLEVSYHLTQGLSIPLLGSVAEGKILFERLANRILGERSWKNQSQALNYLAESAKAYLPKSSSLALLSTLAVDETDISVQAVKQVLHEQGFDVRFAGDVSHNAAVMNTVQESDCIVLVERCGTSGWIAIEETVVLAKDLNTPICGFVLI